MNKIASLKELIRIKLINKIASFRELKRVKKIQRFADEINKLLNPFVYGVLGSKEYFPDIDVYIQPQFSQRGEDLIIESIINAILVKEPNRNKVVRYLEIGANHPIASSSTFLFYARGARGVLIEANPKLIASLQSQRSEDKIIHAAVVNTNSKFETLYIANKSELSSTRNDLIEKFPGGRILEEIVVPAKNINEVIANYWLADFVNLLIIDVEGKDFDLIQTADLANFQFDIIQIEPSDHLIPGNRQNICSHLAKFGYILVSNTEVNLIFTLQKNLDDGSNHEFQFQDYGVVRKREFYNSFDVFDTLIARRRASPTSIFEQLTIEFGNIIKNRIEADNGKRTLDEIYEFCGLSEAIKLRELELELDNCIPIEENIRKVCEGDLLVSDTYLPRSFVLHLLQKCGLKKNVGLYVSNGDKWTGDFWQKLETRPRLHLGDNEISDFQRPISHDITAMLTSVGACTKMELDLNQISYPMGFFVRECRLARIADTWENLAITTNIPMLFSACSIISRKGRRPVFLGRDCQSLSQIYEKHFGDCVYLPFSRKFAKDRLTARNYLLAETLPSDLIIDLVSTGSTWNALSIERDMFCLIHSDFDGYVINTELHNFTYLFKSSELGGTTFLWEILNCADHGMLVGIIDNSWKHLEFAEHELPKAFVSSMKAVSQSAINTFDNYDKRQFNENPENVFKYCHERLKIKAQELEVLFRPITSADSDFSKTLLDM